MKFYYAVCHMLVCVYVVKTEASIDFDGFLSIFDKDMEKECLCVCAYMHIE